MIVPVHEGPLDEGSEPTLWVNPDHVVSVRRIETREMEGRVALSAEMKVTGEPLQRLKLGVYERAEADARWAVFVAELNRPEDGQRS